MYIFSGVHFYTRQFRSSSGYIIEMCIVYITAIGCQIFDHMEAASACRLAVLLGRATILAQAQKYEL